MDCYLVTEGENDRAVISRLLEPEIRDGKIRVVAGGGRSSSLSLARSYLVARHKPVALLVDADTMDPARQDEQKSYLDESMKAVSRGIAYRVVLAAPEFEGCLFDFTSEADRELLKGITGVPLTTEEAIRGEFVPKEVLNSLFLRGAPQAGYSGAALAQRLDEQQVTRLRESALIKEILTFVEEACRQPA